VQTTVPVGTARTPSEDFASPATPSDAPMVMMPPVMTAGAVQVMYGQTVGNSTEMRILVDDQPVRIVAAKPGTAFWDVPKTLAPGPHRVVVSPGPGFERVVMAVRVLGFAMRADQTSLLRGQSTQMHVTVTGLEDLPASAWASATPPSDLVDIVALRKRVQDFRAPQPSERGAVLLILENRSPNTIRMGKRGDSIVLLLHQQDFAHGTYTYQDKLQSLQSGGFDIEGTVVAFLNPIAGQPLH